MERYDDATLSFINKVAGEGDAEDLTDKALVAAKQTVSSKNPVHAAVKLTTTALANKAFTPEEKQAAAPLSPLGLYRAMNTKFGREWMDWEPETLWQSFSESGVPLSDENRNTAMALQVLVNTNAAHEHWHIFEKTGHALNHNPVEFAVVQPLELNEIARTLKIMQLIRPKDAVESDVCGYIAAAARNSGVVFLPPDIFGSGCQSFLDDLNNDMKLKAEVAERWPGEPKKEDSLALKIQLLRLKEIQDYLAGRG